MKSVSENYFKPAIYESSRDLKVRLTIIPSSSSERSQTVYTEANIKSISTEGSVQSDNGISVGSTVSQSLKVELIPSATISQNDVIKLEYGLSCLPTVDPYEFVTVGFFYIYEITKGQNSLSGNGTVNIEAYDKMLSLESSLPETCLTCSTVRELADLIKEEAGMEFSGNAIPSASLPIRPLTTVVTIREALSYLSAVLYGNAIISVEDKTIQGVTQKVEVIKIMQWNTNSVATLTPKNYFTCTLDEYETRIGYINCVVDDETTLTASGQTAGSLLEISNPIMTQDLLNGVMLNINAFQIRGYSIEVQGNPALEPGDVITVNEMVNDSQGNPIQHRLVVMGCTLNYSGGLRNQLSGENNSDNAETASSSETRSNYIQKNEMVSTAWSTGRYKTALDILSDVKALIANSQSSTSTSPNRIQSIVADGSIEKEKLNMASIIAQVITDIHIGGRNLALDTSGVNSYASVSNKMYDISDYGLSALPEGESVTITLSFDAKATVAHDIDIIYSLPSGEYSTVVQLASNIDLTTSYQHFTSTVTVARPTGYTGICFRSYLQTGVVSTVSVINFKMELGNEATDWTPAPEDIDQTLIGLDTRVETISSTIEQKLDGITTTVTDAIISSSDTAKREAVEESKSQLDQTASALSLSISNTSTEIKDLTSKAVEVSKLFTFDTSGFNISTGEGSVTKMHLDDDELSFYVGENKAAWLTNDELKARNLYSDNQVAYYNQWATRKGQSKVVGDKTLYNLNDMWIGG